MIKKKIFVLVDNGAFDEGIISTRSRHYPVHMHNKYKPENVELIFYIGQFQVLFHI